MYSNGVAYVVYITKYIIKCLNIWPLLPPCILLPLNYVFMLLLYFYRIDKWDCIWRLRWANFQNDLCRLYNASQQHISQRYLRLSSQRFIRHLWRGLQRTRNGQFQLVTSTQNQRANTTVRKYTTILCILIESSSRINLVLWSWYKSQFLDPRHG